MGLPRLEGVLQRMLRHAAAGHTFLLACAGLALAGTASAAFPVTAVVVPATLLARARWRQVTLATAVGSAVGATLLVAVFHHLGWGFLYAHFPELAANATWHEVMGWASQHGTLALFIVAATPLPQTPALIFFGVAQQNYAGVFLAMLAGKLLKYGALAWLAAAFPERFLGRAGRLFSRRRWQAIMRWRRSPRRQRQFRRSRPGA